MEQIGWHVYNHEMDSVDFYVPFTMKENADGSIRCELSLQEHLRMFELYRRAKIMKSFKLAPLFELPTLPLPSPLIEGFQRESILTQRYHVRMVLEYLTLVLQKILQKQKSHKLLLCLEDKKQ